ncbi:MAG: Hpt domain-containing protein, partial [Opitutaceae bacterium]
PPGAWRATHYPTVARHAPGGTGAPAAATTAHPAESFEDAPVFDVEAALGFLGGNRDLLVRSARMFVASNQHDVEQILALIAAPDLKTASRRFHRLKARPPCSAAAAFPMFRPCWNATSRPPTQRRRPTTACGNSPQ